MKTDPNAKPSQILAALRPKPPVAKKGLNLKKLEEERKDATADKAELFDFYHQNWGKVVDELQAAQDRLHAIDLAYELNLGGRDD